MFARLLLAAACLLALTPRSVVAQTAADSAGVRRAALDYVEGFYEGDSAKHVRSIRPEVFKYGFWLPRDSTRYVGEQMTWPEFHAYTGRMRSRGTKTPDSAPREIRLLDVQDQTAAAKLTAWWGTDYLLLGKYDGRWMISHVLWQSTPRRATTGAMAEPAGRAVSRESLTVRNGRVVLPAVLFRPQGISRPAAAVYVQGRGCGPMAGAERQAEQLAARGLAVLVYDKRGADPTVRRCEITTIGELAGDVEAAVRLLARRPDIDASRIGTFSNSAGGWVSARASASTAPPLAFMVMLVGPATSVEEQQVSSMREVVHRLHVTPADSTQGVRYAQLMFADGSRTDRYKELTRLLAEGRRAGWAQAFLDEDDIAPTEAWADSLWARRNAYDPAAALRRFGGPVLAIYGGADEVVLAGQNAALMKSLTGGRASVVVVPDAGHGLGPQLWPAVFGFLDRAGLLSGAPAAR